MDVREVVEMLRALKPLLTERYKVQDIGVFGSFARAQQGAESDLDLLVDFAENADLFDLVGLSLYLEEIFARPVDVVPRRALRPELREVVLADLVMV